MSLTGNAVPRAHALAAVEMLHRFSVDDDFADASLPAAVATCWLGWRLANHSEQGGVTVVVLARRETWAVITVDLTPLPTEVSWPTMSVSQRRDLLAEAFEQAEVGRFAEVLDRVSTPVPDRAVPVHVVQASTLLDATHPDSGEVQTLMALGGFHNVGQAISETRWEHTEASRLTALQTRIDAVVREHGEIEGWDYLTVELRVDTEFTRAREHMLDWVETQPSLQDTAALHRAWDAEVDRYLAARGW